MRNFYGVFACFLLPFGGCFQPVFSTFTRVDFIKQFT